jgi:hypothetical protein
MLEDENSLGKSRDNDEQDEDDGLRPKKFTSYDDLDELGVSTGFKVILIINKDNRSSSYSRGR